MSCPNFTTLKDFPLIVYKFDYKTAKEEYERYYSEPYTQEMAFYDEEAEIDAFNEEVKEFADTLKYYKLELKSGYFEGVQFYVEDACEYWALDDLDDLTDEDAEDLFGEKAATIRLEVAQEKQKILDFMREYLRRGWTELSLRGIFSNGEAVYKEIKHNN